VRLTAVKKDVDRKLAERFMTPERLASFRGCGHEVGDEFVCEPVAQPEGMCPWAWADVESFVRIAAFEGRLDGATPPNSWVRWCTDAFRPVSFLIEPLEEEADPEA
jgi:uncharacterized repeat protein (TIGR04076 family)